MCGAVNGLLSSVYTYFHCKTIHGRYLFTDFQYVFVCKIWTEVKEAKKNIDGGEFTAWCDRPRKMLIVPTKLMADIIIMGFYK